MSYAPLDPSQTVVLFADLQAGIIELSATNEVTRLRRAVYIRDSGLLHTLLGIGDRRTQAGAELDLLLFLKGQRIGIEIKRADAPKMTPSMGSALEDLELHRLLVVYPGSVRYTLHPKVEVMSLSQCVAEPA